MAQAQTRTAKSSGSSGSTRSSRSKANGRSSGSSSTKSRSNGSKPRSNATKARSTATKARSSTKSRAKRSRASANGAAESVKDTVATGAEQAANGISTVAQKAKVPLLASGAALAGVAGAVLVTRSGKKRKVLGVSMPKRSGFKADARKITGAVTDAAKRADTFGQRVSRVASSVQNVSETANDAVKKT